MKVYIQLILDDRIRIETLLWEWKSYAYIAKKLWRSRSTIIREVRRNSVRGMYNAKKADIKAKQKKYWKRKQSKKIRANDKLEYIVRRLLLEWKSAEKVANRIQYEWRIRLSWSTVRRYIHSKFARDLKLKLEERKLLKRYKNRKRWSWKWRIPMRIDIDSRPSFISMPWTTWHYECDFIASIKWDKTVFMTLVDKYSRFKIALKLEHKEARLVEQELKRVINIYGIKSITFDNDLSFARHYKLWIFTYFSHPYHAREKGQIENANRWRRRFFPKRTILKNIPQEDLDEATNYLNHDPMECLGWRSPYEVHFKTFVRYLPVMLY